MERKNILIGKVGKTVKFFNNKIETGGGNDVIFYSTLARMHPECMLYIVGPNELSKVKGTKAYKEMFPNDNIRSVYDVDKTKLEGRFDKIIENINRETGGKIDCALFFSGMASNVNVPGFLKKKDGTDYRPLNSYLMYVAPYIYTLNETGCPFYCIAEDARYITINGKDLYNRERLIFTQYNGIAEAYKHVLNKTDIYDFHVTKHKAVYSSIEKIPLLGVPDNWRDSISISKKIGSDPSQRFFVLSNGCGTARINHAGNNSSRLPVYRQWVYEGLKGTPYEGAKVYGKWDAEIYDENPWIEEKYIVNMSEEISRCKYSLVYSQVRGFVTAKAYELICLGIIPMIHPDYDPDRLLSLPEYCYVNSPSEMVEKMKAMDADNTLYRKVLNECMDSIKDSWRDGTEIINKVMSGIASDLSWNDYSDASGVPVIFTHFAKDVYDYEERK